MLISLFKMSESEHSDNNMSSGDESGTISIKLSTCGISKLVFANKPFLRIPPLLDHFF